MMHIQKIYLLLQIIFNTHEGGTHLTGFKTALTKVLNDYARKYNLLKENDKNLNWRRC